MLTLTENAAEAIRGIVSSTELPEGAGLRIATQPGAAEPGLLEVTVAQVPAASDRVVDDDGARVFVEEGAVELLDDRQLDAEIEGHEVGFLITDQPD